MSIFRLIVILVLGIGIIEALPVGKPTLKPNSKSISKLSVFRAGKSKSLVAEEKKLSRDKASKVALENAEDPKSGNREKKATTFCVEIRPDPVNKVCDPVATSVVHEHHIHHSSLPDNPIPSGSPAPTPRPEVPDVPIVVENGPERPLIVEPPPPPSHHFVIQPQSPNCIYSSLGRCPPSIYPSGYVFQRPESTDPASNFFFGTDPMVAGSEVEAPSNHIEQPLPAVQSFHGVRTIDIPNPAIPVNGPIPQQQGEYPTHVAVPPWPHQVSPQSYRQYQQPPCGSARSSTTNVDGISPSETVQDLKIPTGPVIPPPVTNWPLGGPRGSPLYPMPADLSDVSNFRMISNSPEAVLPVGYQTMYHSYDRPQGPAGLQIPSEQGSHGQRIRLQRQQTEEPKIEENNEKSTNTPEPQVFGDLMSRMRASQDSWRLGPTMQTFPREKTDQMHQLRVQAAQQLNVNQPSSDHPIGLTSSLDSEGQSIVSNVKEIGQKSIESSLSPSENKQP